MEKECELPNIFAGLLGGVDPQELLETLARFMKETRATLKSIERRLDNIEGSISSEYSKRAS